MFKVTITRTSAWDYEEKVELKTLDELVNFVDKYECDLFVVCVHSPTEVEVEIYDTWREQRENNGEN